MFHMSEPKMMRAKGDGIEIQLAVWEGREPAVLCVHGLTANCRCWDVIAEGLAPENRVLAVDLRGRGLSDKPATGYSVEHHVRDLTALMDDLGLPQAVLMGHSLGAYIAMALAADHPERAAGLILVDGGGDLSQDQWDRIDGAIRPAVERLDKTFPSFQDFFALMKQAPFLQPWSEAIEGYFRYDLVESRGGVRSRIDPAHIREEMVNKRRSGSGGLFARLSCPALILRATEGIVRPDDILLPQAALDEMLSEIPDARCVDLPGTNHYSIVLQPNAGRERAIREFLAANRRAHDNKKTG
jgi:pimeloyl-ACP methyl ester carboxylesterase